MPATIGTTSSRTASGRRNLRRRHNQGAGGCSPNGSRLSSISASTPPEWRGGYLSGGCGGHEYAANHVALDGLVGRVAGEERQRGVGGGVDDVDVAGGDDLVARHL